MESIYQFSKASLSEIIKPIDPARYRVDQIWDGIYNQYYQLWDEFSTLPSQLNSFLSKNYAISPLQRIDQISSKDKNTRKLLFKLVDQYLVESVIIRSDERNTICISTQAGCPVGCVFCATGATGFQRNLSHEEIISQVTFIAYELRKTGEEITNIVLMGMGEPFLNYEETVLAVSAFNDLEKFDIGARRITISTIGIPDKIKAFAHIGKQYNLAISLHAPNDALRSQLVPLAKKISIASILEAAEYYINERNRRITYEYVLIKGVNDQRVHAQELAALLKNQNCHVNLIALNKNDHYAGVPPQEPDIRAFSEILLQNKIPTTTRNSQGATIQAGCGQLSGEYRSKQKRRNAGFSQ